MATPIRLKRSAVEGRVPSVSDLQLGELALNFYDGKLYVKQKQGEQEAVVEIGANVSSVNATSGISTIGGDKLDINTLTEINDISIAADSSNITTINSPELRLTSSSDVVSVDGRLNVSGITSTSGLIATDAGIGDVRIGVSLPNQIDTISGALRISSSANSVLILDNTEVQQSLSVGGFLDVTSNITSAGYGRIKDVRIGFTTTNEIDTSAGILILDSNAGLVYVDDDLEVAANSIFRGAATFGYEVGIASHLNVAGVSTFVGESIFQSGLTAGDIIVGDDSDPNLIFASGDDLVLSSSSQVVKVLFDGDYGRNLNVVGLSTFGNTVDINGGAYVQDIRIGLTNTRTIDVVGGDLRIIASDDLILDGGDKVYIDSNLQITGVTTASAIDATTVTASTLRTGTDATTSIAIDNNSIKGPAEILIDPAPHDNVDGNVRIRGDLYVQDLYVEGQELIVDSTRIELADFNVGIASTVTTNALLNGAGIGIGATGIRKTLTYDNTNDALKSSENFNLAAGKTYQIDGVDVIGGGSLNVNRVVADHVIASGLSTVGVLTATGSIFGNFDGNLNNLGNTHYVATTGSDTESGSNINQPFRTIKHALSVASSGDIVLIAAGEFEEICPLEVPPGVTVKGAGLRGTTIRPTTATNTQDVFQVDNIVTLEDFTIKGSFYNTGTDTGYAFTYATGAIISTRSPYIQRVTVLNRGSTVTTDDPYGYNSADAGRGAKVDGSLVSSSSIEAGMLFNEVTFFTPNQKGTIVTNGGRVEYLNSFHYFASEAIVGESGSTGIGGNANARLRVEGLSVVPLVNDVIELYNSGGVGIATGTVVSHDVGLVTIQGKGIGTFIEGTTGVNQDIQIKRGGALAGAATTIAFADYGMFGAEMRSVGCAVEYGQKGIVADGIGVKLRLISINFNHVGSGKDFSNDDTLTVQANEVTELNSGQVSFVSIDQKGDFRVGDAFVVDQENGNVAFAATSNFSVQGSVQVTGGVGVATLSSTDLRVGDLQLDTNKVQSLVGDIVLDSAGGKVHIQDSAEVDGSLTVDGNTTIGSADNDDLTVNAEAVFNAVTSVRNVRIGTTTNEIDTTSGKLTLDSAEGTVEIVDQLEVTGISSFADRTKFNTTDSVKLPVGTTAERTTNETGSIRFNSTSGQFEGYGNAAWGSLGGVKDVDQDTFINPESAPGQDEDTLSFVCDGTTTVGISSTNATFNTEVSFVTDVSAASSVTAASFHGKGGNLTLGGNVSDNPTDGSYTSGGALNTINSTTKIVDSVDGLNELAFNIIKNTAVTDVDFTSDVSSGGSPLTVTLNITSSGNANIFDIDFGNGSQITTADSTPTNIYNAPSGGSFGITVTARNSSGVGAGSSQTISKSNFITLFTPNPQVDFDIFANFTGGSEIQFWDSADQVFLDNNTSNTNVTGANAAYTINWGDGVTDTITSDTAQGGALGSRLNHTYTNAAETDALRTAVLTLTNHDAADPAVIPTSHQRQYKVYATHTPSLSGVTTIGINSISAGGYPVTLTNTTENTIGSFAQFGIQYRYVWGDGTTDTINVGTGVAGDTGNTISHTYDLTSNAAGISSTYNARLEVISSHTSSPFLSSDFEVLVEPETRSAFSGTAVVTSDRNGDNAQTLYDGVDLSGNNRRIARFTNTSENATDYVWSWGDGSSSNVVASNSDPGGTGATIDHTFQGSTGNKNVQLVANGSPGHLSQTKTSSAFYNLKAIPAAPTSISSHTLSLAHASEGLSPKLASGATDNTGGTSGLSAGDAVTRYAGALASIATVQTPYLNGSTAGHTLRSMLNGSNDGDTIFTNSTGETGVFTSLIVHDEGDAHDEISSSTYPSDFYQVFVASISKNYSALANGINNFKLKLEGTDGGESSSVAFVKDNLNITPTLTAGTLSESSGGTKRYISGIPYYNSGSPTLTLTGVTVENLTGQTFRQISNVVEVDPGTNHEGTSQGAISDLSFGYVQIDGSTTMLSGGNPIANTGISGPYTIGNLIIPITTSSRRTVQQLKLRASNVVGTSNYVNNTTKVQVHTAAQSGIVETAIPVSDSLGSTHNDDGVRIFDFASSTADNPTYNSSTNFYTSNLYSEGSDPGVSGTKEATIRLGVLKHDTTDYSTGFLPVGPDRSGDTGTQYFTFAFRRQTVANFSLSITSAGVAGVWIAAPGTAIDNTSGLNGWLRCDSVAPPGIPGSNTGAGGNGSDGCAKTSGDTISPNTALSGSKTMTLGSENMSNATGNVVLVRIALSSGQSITNLSVGEA